MLHSVVFRPLLGWEEQDRQPRGTTVVARRIGMKEVQVLIAGAGPVGMTLARDLARRDITCMLV
jgi:hypothetical protein